MYLIKLMVAVVGGVLVVVLEIVATAWAYYEYTLLARVTAILMVALATLLLHRLIVWMFRNQKPRPATGA